MTTDLSKTEEAIDQTELLLREAGMESQAELHKKVKQDPVELLRQRFREIDGTSSINIITSGSQRSWTELSAFKTTADLTTREASVWLKLIAEANQEKLFPQGSKILSVADEAIGTIELFAIGHIHDARGKLRLFLIAPFGVSDVVIDQRVSAYEVKLERRSIQVVEDQYRAARRLRRAYRVANWTDSERAYWDIAWLSIASTIPLVLLTSWPWIFMVFAFYLFYFMMGGIVDAVSHSKGGLGNSANCCRGTVHHLPDKPTKPRSLMSARELKRQQSKIAA